jgi:hypothetical protein
MVTLQQDPEARLFKLLAVFALPELRVADIGAVSA